SIKIWSTKAHHLLLTIPRILISTHITQLSRSDIISINRRSRWTRRKQLTTFAMVNQYFIPDFALVNEGKGKKMGVELTLGVFSQ
ncbi:MAG: hypothetical protein IPN86_21230, partial [Saprospiraceae bacterium]|nr:hypothetical protein [Saprospiraceae bacterium]